MDRPIVGYWCLMARQKKVEYTSHGFGDMPLDEFLDMLRRKYVTETKKKRAKRSERRT